MMTDRCEEMRRKPNYPLLFKKAPSAAASSGGALWRAASAGALLLSTGPLCSALKPGTKPSPAAGLLAPGEGTRTLTLTRVGFRETPAGNLQPFRPVADAR